MCIYLTINDTCDCQSVIKISIEGDITSGDVDLFSIFSFENNDGTDKFLSFINAWSVI